MKIGIITDVHNNVIALNSMLAVFEEEGCDEIICCGDIIGIGPFPEETVQRIKSLPNIRCVLGNHEKYLIHGIKKPYPSKMSEDEALHHKWEHSLLSYDSKKYIEELNMNPNLINRDLNVGFSGGEKKKNEILQLLVLNPKLAILDETDSGLDVDAIRTVSKGINLYKNEEKNMHSNTYKK